jgi:alpha-D-xyloside xylohydrolase
MGAFDLDVPNWGRIPPARVTGPAAVDAGGTVNLPTSAGVLRVSLHECGVRLQLGPPARDYGILSGMPATLAPEVASTEGGTRISHGELALTLGHEPLSFALSRGARQVQQSPGDGHFVRRFRLPPFARLDDGWFVSLDLGEDTAVYGLGEKWGRLDRRGQLVRSFNHDALGVNAEASYKNAPFAWSPDGWGVFVHTAAAVTHGVGHAPWSQRAYALWVDSPSLDLFLLDGEDGAAQLRQYTALTGRAPVPPRWSLGVILSKAYYRDADEILAVAREVRARGMPCVTITFDGRAWQDTDTRFAFEWCPRRYPDPAPVIAELKSLGFRICVWEYPLISVRNPLFAELAAKGWLLKDRRSGEAYRYQWDLEPFGAVLTPLPESGLLDFTHPDAYAYWRDRHRELFAAGVDMIKADFGEQVDGFMVASDGSSGSELHNAYALLYNRCVYEAAERYAPGGAFLFSRSAWAGSQRYPSQWGGDPQADWGGLAASLRGGLSWGLSGGPYYATDVGGFYADRRDPELYVRWAQAAVYSAHMRLHGIGPREPWSYGPEAEAAVNAALELRYRLIPYLERAMAQAHETGLPVQRAMALACPGDRVARSFENQFFCGDDLLVAPCLRPGGEVEVYLPAGRWRRFPGGTVLEGGRTLELKLALDETAVFARDDAVIPLGPAVRHTGELAGGGLRTEEPGGAPSGAVSA